METVARVDDVTTAKASSARSEMPDSAVCRLVQVDGDGDLIPSMGDEFMEVEEFLDDVHPVGDLVENVVSTPNSLIPTNKIQNANLVAVTGNEFMEVEDVLEHLHPVGESEKNVILAVNEETHNGKTDDGELVTALNNELMEAEDFLKDVHAVKDSKENVVCTLTDDTSTSKLGNGELVPCTTDVEVEDFLNDVHPVQDNEQNDICPSSDGIITSQGEDPVAVVEKGIAPLDAEKRIEESTGRPEGIVSPSTAKSNDSHIYQSANSGEYSKSVDERIKRESSGPSGSTCASSKPDFSKLKGKICLDSLSVRELQETFRAAFGRETSVKDKQWLKRRISMGLSNSCHVLSMTFVIDEGNTVKIVREEGTTAIEDTSSKDLIVGEMNENSGGLPMGVDIPSEDPENVSGQRWIYPSAGNDCGGEDEQRSGVENKRVRKPTKRYIEELSELESRENTENIISVSKNLRTRSASKPCVRAACDAQSSRTPLVTRLDSFGGSGIQIPYVCRIRRSRPRENYVAFMKLQPGSMDGSHVTTKLVKETLGSCGPPDDDGENTFFSGGSDSAWVRKLNMEEPEKERPCQERETCESEKDEENVEPSRGDLPTDNSDSDSPNVEMAKGGVRRKHHRPWSLTEVVNLVEGVERFGAGRWSEIKRLSFASHSYRTSVDLKDKWRNLLRASFAQPAAEKGNFRKQVSAPIPPQILVRVRELAKMQAQVPPVLNSSKFNGGNVHASSRGYL